MFNKRKRKLRNGQTVKLGDIVSFINSDGEECIGKIEKRKYDTEKYKKGSLFFWNATFDILDYYSLKKNNRRKK